MRLRGHQGRDGADGEERREGQGAHARGEAVDHGGRAGDQHRDDDGRAEAEAHHAGELRVPEAHAVWTGERGGGEERGGQGAGGEVAAAERGGQCGGGGDRVGDQARAQVGDDGCGEGGEEDRGEGHALDRPAAYEVRSPGPSVPGRRGQGNRGEAD